MTVKNLIDLLEDKDTPLYLAYSAVDSGESPDDRVRLNPRSVLLCEVFNDYLVESILPVAEDKNGNDYGGGLIVYLKTEIKLLKKSD